MQDEQTSGKQAEEQRRSVRERYAKVSVEPSNQFSYPVGRDSAAGLGYERAWIETVRSEIVDRFVGVGNPFVIQRPAKGEYVLDLGCGSGLDVFVAALLVGPEGRTVGLDMTAEMLEWPRQAVADWPLGNVGFCEGLIEALPFTDGLFDVVLSNGVLNLVPDKDAAFREIHRVLKTGGIFAAADLLVTETIPAKLLADMDAWST